MRFQKKQQPFVRLYPILFQEPLFSGFVKASPVFLCLIFGQTGHKRTFPFSDATGKQPTMVDLCTLLSAFGRPFGKKQTWADVNGNGQSEGDIYIFVETTRKTSGTFSIHIRKETATARYRQSLRSPFYGLQERDFILQVGIVEIRADVFAHTAVERILGIDQIAAGLFHCSLERLPHLGSDIDLGDAGPDRIQQTLLLNARTTVQNQRNAGCPMQVGDVRNV